MGKYLTQKYRKFILPLARFPVEVLKKIADIFAELGTLILASIIIPALFGNKPNQMVLGTVIGVVCWISSLIIIHTIK
jgi:hypothetical protein